MRFDYKAYDRAFPRSEAKPVVQFSDPEDNMVPPETKPEVKEADNGTPRTDESPTE